MVNELHEDINIRKYQYSKICYAADQYLTNQYHNDSEVVDDIDSVYQFNVVLLLVLEELRDLGIEYVIDPEELFSDGYRVDTLYYLRRNFDKDYLSSVLKRVDSSVISTISSTIEEEPSELLVKMLELFKRYLALDESWTYLYENEDMYTNNILFVSHVSAILESIPDITDIPELLNDFRNKKLADLHKRQERAMLLAKQIFKHTSVPKTPIIDYITSMELELIQPRVLSVLSISEHILPSYYINYQHKFEYYINSGIKQPTETQMILLIVGNYHEDLSKEDLKEKFRFMVGDLFVNMSFIYKLIDLIG